MLSEFAGPPRPDSTKYLVLPVFLEVAWTGDISKMRTVLDDPYSRDQLMDKVDEITGMTPCISRSGQ